MNAWRAIWITMYSARAAVADDIVDLVCMKRSYFFESSYRNYTWRFDKAWDFFVNALADPDTDVVIVERGGQPAGYGVISYDSSFMDEEIVVVSYLYIMPDHRQKQCSQMLLDFVLKLCEHRNVQAIYASNTAGFSDNGANARAFSMMMTRHGFQQFGFVFRKGSPL